jgi:tRNA/rRNA methyltransferase
MKNFGLRNLRVVSPRTYDADRAYKLARGGKDIIDNMLITNCLKDATEDLVLVGATTARQGNARSDLIYTPEEGCPKLIEGTRNGKVGILFGPEEHGLSTRDLDLSSINITIPTSPDYSSLNLGQAVLLMCYQLFSSSVNIPKAHIKRRAEKTLATGKEKEAFFESARKFLLKAGFLNKENPDAVLLHLRKLLNRAIPTTDEVKILRGIIRQVKWYTKNKPSDD